MLFPLFLILGVAVLSVALRSFQNPFSQKAGAVGILVASFLLVYFLTNSYLWGRSSGRQLVFSPVGGNPYSHSHVAFAERKTTSSEKRAFDRHVSESQWK